MMKSKLFFAALAAIAVLTLNSCQVAELVISGTTYYDAEITTNDNRLIAGRIGGQRSSNLPAGAKTISIKTEQGRQKVKSTDIQYMKLSRKAHPEKQQVLIYSDLKYPYTKKGEQKFRMFKMWQVVESYGDNLVITAYGGSYGLSKDGALVITYRQDEGIRYCIRRVTDDCPIYVARNNMSKASMRKIWQHWLADDPALCEKIADKTVGAYDFKTIVEMYNPSSE